MSQDPSAVLLDAADSQTESGEEAHDTVPDAAGDGGREASREATQAIRPASLDLESSAVNGTESSPHDLKLHPSYQRDSSHDVLATDHHNQPCVTTTAHDTTKHLAATVDGNHDPHPVAPSISSIVPPSPLPRDTPPPSPTATKTTIKASLSTAAAQKQSSDALSNSPSLLQKRKEVAAGATNIPHERNMIFGYQATGAGNASYRRRQYANTNALTDYEADLTGKDRAKQKEAVKRLLLEKVKDDWKWEWPRPEPKPEPEPEPESHSKPQPETEPASEHDIKPILSHESLVNAQQGNIIEEQWKERDEWASNASDSEQDTAKRGPKLVDRPLSGAKNEPFRFESPDDVGVNIKKTQSDRKRRRKKRLAEEMAWNDGVRCFHERRDAWTGARRVSRYSSTRAKFPPIEKLRKSTSHSSEDGGSSTAIEPEASDPEEEWEADIEIPIAPPLIPPTNAMRASITPTAYNTIYDKVILQQLTPSCPINLKDITRSCVQGWKRDGEWPPNSSVPETLAGRRRRKLSMASLFGLEKTKSKEEKEKEKEKEKIEKEKAQADSHKSSDDHKPGAFKRITRKLLLLGKDKEHGEEHHGKVEHHRNSSHGSNASHGKKETAVGHPVI